MSGDDQNNGSGNGEDQKSQGGGKDPGTGDPKTDSMLEKVEARKKELDRKLDESKEPEKPEITSRFIQDCLYANELGDGMLAAALFNDRFLYVKSSEEWLSWEGHHWERDIMAKSRASVEEVAQEYLIEAARIVGKIGEAVKNKDSEMVNKLQDTQGTIYKRVGRLRSERGRVNTLKFAHTNISNQIAIKGDELDINPWLFACSNGVIDLRTGELRDGRPDDLISKASPVEFTGIDMPAPVWERTLKQIFKEHQPLVDFIQRLFGYSLAGLTVEHVFPIFWGQGRNGKDTIIETISYIMGDLACSIPSEMLLDQGRVRNSAGPSPDIMGLYGRRFVFASETDQGRRFSTGRVKLLTGGGEIIGRNPHDKYETKFNPTHTFLLMTNSKPEVYDDGLAFWERVYLIPFEISFVDRKLENENERPVDKHLQQKLLKESPGILAWLVRGFFEWEKLGGLCPPPMVIKASAEYRQDEDQLGHFIKDCCYKDTEIETTAKELYKCFSKWWKINVSSKVLSQKKFGGMMVKKFKRSKSGTYRYFGIGLLPDWDSGE